MTGSAPKKMLIIDDDSRNIFALKAVLTAKGYDCLTATGASAGIKLLAENNDVGTVLLDMMMPEIDGYAAISMIRNGPQNHVTIISVTAQAMQGDKNKCLNAGADGYISKPIDVDQLLILLKEHLK